MGKRLLAFCHIPKTAGMSWTRILRGYFGLKHLSVISRNPSVGYTLKEMKFDLKIFPWVESLSGHPLRPYINYGALSRKLVWYTFLREPKERFLSQYQHEVEKGGKKESLEEWMERYNRRNFQVRWIAGKEDVELAKNYLEKFVLVGRQDQFMLSIKMLKMLLYSLDMPMYLLNLIRPVNTFRDPNLRLNIEREASKLEKEIFEYNRLDFELWNWFVKNYWPEQVEKLQNFVSHQATIKRDVSLLQFKTNLVLSFITRNFFYKIFARFHSFLDS